VIISHNSYTDFHLLLHLKDPAIEFLEMLRQSGFTEEKIHLQLSIPGSRFYPEFANDIASLLTHLNIDELETHTEMNGNRRFIGKADSYLYPRGCGTNTVVPFDSLTKEQQSKVFFKYNRGYLVRHLLVNELPSTVHFIAILKSLKSGVKLITAFPGEHSMPMPHHGMKPSLYKACKEFWDQHVILLNE
jgi:hypothetical protein